MEEFKGCECFCNILSFRYPPGTHFVLELGFSKHVHAGLVFTSAMKLDPHSYIDFFFFFLSGFHHVLNRSAKPLYIPHREIIKLISSVKST